MNSEHQNNPRPSHPEAGTNSITASEPKYTTQPKPSATPIETSRQELSDLENSDPEFLNRQFTGYVAYRLAWWPSATAAVINSMDTRCGGEKDADCLARSQDPPARGLFAGAKTSPQLLGGVGEGRRNVEEGNRTARRKFLISQRIKHYKILPPFDIEILFSLFDIGIYFSFLYTYISNLISDSFFISFVTLLLVWLVSVF